MTFFILGKYKENTCCDVKLIKGGRFNNLLRKMFWGYFCSLYHGPFYHYFII